MANVARLGVVLGMNSAEFTAGLNQAKSELLSFKNALSGGAIVAFTAQLATWADQLTDTADAFDMTVQSVLNLGEALGQSGGNFDDTTKVLSKFTTTLDSAVNAGKDAQEAFKKVGVTFDDLRHKDVTSLFQETVAGLAAIEDPVTRDATAFNIFGKAIKGVDLLRLNEELKNTNKATDEQVNGIKAAGDSVDMFKKSWHELNVILAEFLGPLAKGFAQVFQDIVDGVDRAVIGIKKLASALDDVIHKIPQLPASPGGEDEFGNALVGGAQDSYQYTRKAGVEKKDPANSPINRNVKAAKDTQLDQLLKELATLKLISKEYEANLSQQLKGIEVQTQKLGLTDNEAQVIQKMYELDKQRAEAIGKLEDKIQTAKDTKADKKVIDTLQEQIDMINKTTDAYKTSMKSAIEYQQTLSQSALGGLDEAYKKYQMMAINTAATVSSTVDALFQGMTDALTAFIMTGKFNFKNFASAIIADIIRIQVQAQASKLFSSVIGWGISALTGSITPGVSTDPAYMGPALPGKATGGDVSAGSPYMVGENGPELFVPGRSGTIVPNSQLSNGSNGTTVVQNFNITAIDPASFNEKVMGTIANNARTVFSVVKTAEKQVGSVSFA